ncbi:AFI1 (YOR129C) [Zygosaccharomyces parabailii]|nr:AFI1 (YOR129C) [Zygosaccharomyces parabailii]
MNVPWTPNVRYLLAAEFDNRYGPVVRNQYPTNIPGFAYRAPDDQGLFNLATLMLPTNAEYKTKGNADTTIFILYRNFDTGEYQLFPPEQVDEVLYFVNVVYAQDDESNARGTKIKAVALGTAMVDFMAFRPFTQAVLDRYMVLQEGVDVTRLLLKACFRLLNRSELTFIKRLHGNGARQSLLQAVGDESLLRLWLDEENPKGINFRKLLKCHHHDKYTNRIALRRGKVSVSLHGYKPKKEFLDLAKISLEFDVVKYGFIDWALKYNSKISRFLLNFIPVLHKRDPKEYSFKLIIFSSVMMGEELSQFTIALSNLMGLGSQSDIPFFTLPYIDVSIIGPLKDYMETQGSFFAIMGTSNPIFRSHSSLWDYYYDLDDETVYEAEGEIEKDITSKWDVLMIKKLLVRNSIAPSLPEVPRMGLLQKIVECIDDEETDMLKVLNAFRRVNILQLLQLDVQALGVNSNLLLDYMCKFRDFAVFTEFFQPETLRLLQQLSLMNEVMTKLQQVTLIAPRRTELVCQLDDALTHIHWFAALDEDHLERFISICFNYPFSSLCSHYDLQEDDLAKVNIRQELKNCFKDDKSWMSIGEENSDKESMLSTFVKDRSISFFCMPLLSDPNFKIKKGHYEPPEVVLRAPANASIRRRRSVNLKQMLTLKNRENGADGSLFRGFSDGFTVPSKASFRRISRSQSSSMLSSKLGPIDVEKKTKDVKNTAYKILCMMHQHFVGRLLIETSLSPFFKSMLNVLKVEEESWRKENLRR